MDCRKPLIVALWLAGGLAGCNTTNPTPIASVSQPLVPGQILDVPLKKEADLPKRAPKAITCVKYGDFAADEATTPNKSLVEVQEQRDVARKAYQQALSIDPKCLPAYQGLTALYVAMKDYKHANATYQDALRHYPKEPSLWYELGMCYGRQKEWEPAIQHLNKAMELDPENRKYANALGYTLARVGRYDDSLAVFGRLLSESEAHYNLARMLRHLNETNLCRQHLQAALQKDPEMKQALALLSELDAAPAPAPDVQQTSFSEEWQLPQAPQTPR
jgi:Flp pilus assembly protein TadD